ncbi:acyltransferase [Pseudomonas sp. B21-054]|uniref:acyltransferase family protein n=1 Tax=Pseudomonas sp. B21-054 TaxID=2895494 RepID=UPI0022303ADB|nr:acyltransferase [Pseudomonas sp. B21-054]UZE19663.1 acyltransferase [Pseudomonas sp. B21-054]
MTNNQVGADSSLLVSEVKLLGAKKLGLEGLNSLRGIAAVLIVIFHVLGMHGLKIPPQFSFVPAYFGLGVPLFFVISAFSLFLSTTSRVGKDGWLSSYAIRRFMRIAPLFYFVATFYLIYIPLQFGSYISPMSYFGTLSLLFNFMPGQHESMVWAGWTIGVEVLFYILVPYLLIFVRNIYISVIAVLAAVALSAVFYKFYLSASYPAGYAYMSFLGSIGVFFFGIFGFFLYSDLKARVHVRGIGYILLFLALLLTFGLVAKEQILLSIVGNRSSLWALVFVMLIVSQCLAPIFAITNPLFSYLGRLSFGLYLCHPPLVYMLKPVYGYFYQYFGDGFAFVSSASVTLLILVPVARLMNFLIEEPGIRLGEKLISRRVGKDFLAAH